MLWSQKYQIIIMAAPATPSYPAHLPPIAPELKTLIDTTVDYILAMGTSATAEADFKRKHSAGAQGSSKFPFLFEGGTGYEYYEFRMGRGGKCSEVICWLDFGFIGWEIGGFEHFE